MIKTVNYKGYSIEIHPQPITGDNNKTYFGIWKDDKKIFGLYEAISRTQSSMLAINDINTFLEQRGLDRIRIKLNTLDYQKGEELEYWES